MTTLPVWMKKDGFDLVCSCDMKWPGHPMSTMKSCLQVNKPAFTRTLKFKM